MNQSQQDIADRIADTARIRASVVCQAGRRGCEWSDEARAELAYRRTVRMQSVHEIASAFGVSRNAVIAQMDRQGLGKLMFNEFRWSPDRRYRRERADG